MLQIRYLTLIFTSFCMGLSACTPTVDIPTASPSVTPKTIISPTPTTTAVHPTPTSELSMNLMLQDEVLAASGFVVEEKKDGTIVLWDQDEGKEHEAFRLNPDGSAVFWGIKPGADGVEEGQIREEVVFSKEQMQGYQVTYESTLGGDRARVVLKDENGQVVSYYQDDVNSWRGEDAASSFVPMGQEIFTQMYGSGGEENEIAIQESVKSNWNLGDKDIVTLTGDNGYVTVSWFDAESGKREVKFYSLITGEERFDTDVSKNYANNNWASDPEWQPTPESRVTVMGHVEGLIQADGTPFDIPISIGAIQGSDIKRIVPSQHMADALAGGYLEAYKSRLEVQTETELTWDEYLLMLQQGQGAPTVPQPNEDAAPNAYYKYTKDAQFNPLAGVAIVFVDARNKTFNLPTKIGPGVSLKNYIDGYGRLVIMYYFSSNNALYNYSEGQVGGGSNEGGLTADEFFLANQLVFPSRVVGSGPDSCLLDMSSYSRACLDEQYSDETDMRVSEILASTVEARREGTLNENLFREFRHTIPPYSY